MHYSVILNYENNSPHCYITCDIYTMSLIVGSQWNSYDVQVE